jgi:hypothetical protein
MWNLKDLHGYSSSIKDNTGDNIVDGDNIVATVAISYPDDNIVAYCLIL